MHYLFEESDLLNRPVECFIFEASKEKFPVKSHWHYFMEIIYMIDGNAEMYSDSKVFNVSKGDMILFPPKSVHAIYSEEYEQLKYAVLKFDINKFKITPFYAPKLCNILKCAQKSNMSSYFPSDITEKLNCKEIFESCTNEIKNYNYGFDIVIKSNIYNLLIKIIRRWLDMGLVIDGKVFPCDGNVGVESITEYIDSNISDKIKVSDLAARCGISYSGFAKEFHNIYGMSCKEYIERMRIFRVEEYLMFTDYDLNYISQESGFSDCSHMIRSFKRLRGITPKQFRMSRRS